MTLPYFESTPKKAGGEASQQAATSAVKCRRSALADSAASSADSFSYRGRCPELRTAYTCLHFDISCCSATDSSVASCATCRVLSRLLKKVSETPAGGCRSLLGGNTCCRRILQMITRANARTILLWLAFTRCSWRVECKDQRRESCSWRLHSFSLLELLSYWRSSAAQDLAALVRARFSCTSCSLSSRVE